MQELSPASLLDEGNENQVDVTWLRTVALEFTRGR